MSSEDRQQKVILIEPTLSGHHGMFLRFFTETLLSMHYHVLICTRNAEEASRLFDNSSVDSHLTFTEINYRDQFYLYGRGRTKKIYVIANLFIILYNLFMLKRKISNKDGLVFFCCSDDYTHDLMPICLFNLLMPTRWYGLTLLSNNPNRIGYIDRRRLFKHKGCKGLAILGYPSMPYENAYKDKIISFPDFTDDTAPNQASELVATILSKARNRKIISMLGAISKRKGIETFIKTSEMADARKYFFLIAGGAALTKDEEVMLHTSFLKVDNCFYHPNRIKEEADFNALANISDILFAAYLDFPASSNILAKASLYKKPLIVSKGYYMQTIVEEYGIGKAIQQCSDSQCLSAIREITSGSIKIEAKGFNAYLEKNSISSLGNAFNQLFEKDKNKQT